MALSEVRGLDPLIEQHRIIRAQQVLDDYDEIFGVGDEPPLWELDALGIDQDANDPDETLK